MKSHAAKSLDRDPGELQSLDDPEFVSLLQESDQDAWSEVHRQRHSPLFQFAHRCTGNRHDAEDIVNEVFAKAIAKIAIYEKRGTIAGWLHTIAKNMITNYLRTNERRQRMMTNMLSFEAGDFDMDTAADPLKIVMHNDTVQYMVQLVQELPDGQRAAMQKLLDGATIPEISAALERNPRAIRARLANACSNLLKMELARV